MQKKLFIICCLGALICAAGYLAHWDRVFAEDYAKVESPTLSHYLIIERVPMFFSMPGGGADARGFVSLYTKSGKRLYRTRIPMVQLVEAEWTADSVYFWNIHWELH